MTKKEEIDEFYEKLEKAIKEISKKDIRIIMGDWDVKIGENNSVWKDNGLGKETMVKEMKEGKTYRICNLTKPVYL